MLVRSKNFSQFVEKIEEMKSSFSKQQNKMRKLRSEMLKIRKNDKIIKLEKNSWKFAGNCYENFPFPGKLKIRKKGKL